MIIRGLASMQKSNIKPLIDHAIREISALPPAPNTLQRPPSGVVFLSKLDLVDSYMRVCILPTKSAQIPT